MLPVKVNEKGVRMWGVQEGYMEVTKFTNMHQALTAFQALRYILVTNKEPSLVGVTNTQIISVDCDGGKNRALWYHKGETT